MADKCYAPVFKGNNIFACLFLTIIYLLIIIGLILATLGLILLFPSGRCLIRQYQFRISHCREGNSDPNRPI